MSSMVMPVLLSLCFALAFLIFSYMPLTWILGLVGVTVLLKVLP
jgi:hypothetical protein